MVSCGFLSVALAVYAGFRSTYEPFSDSYAAFLPVYEPLFRFYAPFWTTYAYFSILRKQQQTTQNPPP